MKKLHIGILVLIMCLVVAASGCTTNNNQSSNSGSNNNTNNSGNSTNSSDVNIVIQYPGSWACDVSGTFGYRSLSGTGDKTTNIGAVTGSVTAAARKTDGTNDVLVVSIVKDGKTLASQSTPYPYGGASAVVTNV